MKLYYLFLLVMFFLMSCERTSNVSESRVIGEEIKAWLDKQTEPYKYVILDDDCDMLPEQFPYFVQTDCLKWGLDDNDVEIAIKKLNV